MPQDGPLIDWYAVLGVPPEAGELELRAAWRQLARVLHPDTGRGLDPGRERRFHLAREAFERLIDPAVRAEHDAARARYAEAVAPLPRGWVERVLGARAAERRSGEDWRCALTLPASARVTGAEQALTLPGLNACGRCDGTGLAPAGRPIVCPRCGGRCFEVHRPVLRVQSEVCTGCDAAGWVPEAPCDGCGGRGRVQGERRVNVTVPPGIAPGGVVRVPGAGGAGRGGAPSGDLLAVVAYADGVLEVHGDDWTAPFAVPFWLALAGGTLEVETPWGPRVVQIPAGLEGGALLRLAGLGVARRGDGFLRVALTWPGPLTPSEADGLRAWGEAVAARQAAGRGGS